MQYLAVLFEGSDPTKGAYNKPPLYVLQIDSPEDLPQDGQTWVLMTQPALSDYYYKYHMNMEPTSHYLDPYTVAYNRVKLSKDFGSELINQVAAENVALNLSTSQVLAVLQRFSAVVSMLSTGSLTSALTVLKQMKGDALVPQSRIDFYVEKIQNFISTNK